MYGVAIALEGYQAALKPSRFGHAQYGSAVLSASSLSKLSQDL